MPEHRWRILTLALLVWAVLIGAILPHPWDAYPVSWPVFLGMLGGIETFLGVLVLLAWPWLMDLS